MTSAAIMPRRGGTLTLETAVGQSVGTVPSRGDGDAARPVRRVRGPGLLEMEAAGDGRAVLGNTDNVGMQRPAMGAPESTSSPRSERAS
jgi:hypothetical protein